MKVILCIFCSLNFFFSYAKNNKIEEKVDTVYYQEIEIHDDVFLKAISIFKDSLKNRFNCDYCSSVFIL
jgi:hypothetical protein